MIGFIKKDLLLIKNNLAVIGIMIVAFCFLSYYADMDLAFLPAYISTVLFISTFSYDEFNRWNAYAITIPNGKNNIVRGKYLASFLLIMFSIVLTALLFGWLVYFRDGYVDIDEILMTMLLSGAACMLIFDFCFPILFKFGASKGRLFMFIVIYGISILLMFIYKFVMGHTISFTAEFMDFMREWWKLIFAEVVILITMFSWLLSEHIVTKKEY